MTRKQTYQTPASYARKTPWGKRPSRAAPKRRKASAMGAYTRNLGTQAKGRDVHMEFMSRQFIISCDNGGKIDLKIPIGVTKIGAAADDTADAGFPEFSGSFAKVYKEYCITKSTLVLTPLCTTTVNPGATPIFTQIDHNESGTNLLTVSKACQHRNVKLQGTHKGLCDTNKTITLTYSPRDLDEVSFKMCTGLPSANGPETVAWFKMVAENQAGTSGPLFHARLYTHVKFRGRVPLN